ncbi:two-component system OmpR family sensor kinase [Streptacidiphilus sp. MAP12-16]|uniref:sensor histidine kinase n=1 Tax=Streptacidiphilus sp. MAP12-16 TaxID=3156300 RepID=UPI003513A8D5
MSFVARLRSRLLRELRGGLSLRGRLLVLAVALLALGLAVSDTLVLGTVRVQMVKRVDDQLRRAAAPMQRHLVVGQAPEHMGMPRGGALPSQFVVAFRQSDGSYTPLQRQPVSASDPQPSLPPLTDAEAAARVDKPFTVPSDHGGGTWRVLYLHMDSTSSVVLVVASSMDDTNATLAKLGDGFLAIGGAVLMLLALAGWFAVRAGLRPLERIETTATEIAAGHPLSHRMPEGAQHTEVGRLAGSLNTMLEQIESAFAARAASEDRMRRFVADASHELRTPLAGIRGFAELYRMGALSEDADIKRTMARIESEAIRMGGLVEDLLTLARLDEQRPLELAPMDLRTLAADALHDTTALDPSRPVALTGPGGDCGPAAALVLGDEARLRQVVTNLVGNAVKHTPPGSPVRIGVGTMDGHGVIEVADHGPGLTPDQAARVFERFYRVDSSRSRQDGGGAGLGLAIVSALTTAHHGEVQLLTAPGAGTVFRIRIPAAH